jgi:predicted Zn-dependent protease
VLALATTHVIAQTPESAQVPATPIGQPDAPEAVQAPDPPGYTQIYPNSQTPQNCASSTALPEKPIGPGPVQECRRTNQTSNASKKSAEYDVSQIGHRSIGKGVNFYSLEKEQALGRALASELEKQVRLLDDPAVSEYINRVGQNLVHNSDAKVPFTIRVIDDDEINAFALPGGFFYVNSGLILAADNEAELAGVMAHEIAHVAARHATRNMTKGRIWNMASIPLILVGGGAGFAIRQVMSVGGPMSFLKFSRDAEREADLLGLEYQYAAGYDPAAFIEFFEKIHALERPQKNSFVSKMFSTHPMTEDRIRRAQRDISTILPAREQYVVSTSDFDDAKARLLKVTGRLKLRNRGGTGTRPTLRRRTPSGAGNEGDESDKHETGASPQGWALLEGY